MLKNRYLVSLGVISFMLSSFHLCAMETEVEKKTAVRRTNGAHFEEKEYTYTSKNNNKNNSKNISKKLVGYELTEGEWDTFDVLDTLYPNKGIRRELFIENLKNVTKGPSNTSETINSGLAAVLCSILKDLSPEETRTIFPGESIRKFASLLNDKTKGAEKKGGSWVTIVTKSPKIIGEFIDYLSQKETSHLPVKRSSSNEMDLLGIVCNIFKLKLDVLIPNKNGKALELKNAFNFGTQNDPQRYILLDEKKAQFCPLCSSDSKEMRKKWADKAMALTGKNQNIDQELGEPSREIKLDLNSTGLAQSVTEEVNGKKVITDDNANASYQLESNRFDVAMGQEIHVPYDITVEKDGRMALGLLNTKRNGWYGPELILSAGTHKGIYIQEVPADETQTSLVFRNYHGILEGGPGQSTFTIHEVDFKID